MMIKNNTLIVNSLCRTVKPVEGSKNNVLGRIIIRRKNIDKNKRTHQL